MTVFSRSPIILISLFEIMSNEKILPYLLNKMSSTGVFGQKFVLLRHTKYKNFPSNLNKLSKIEIFFDSSTTMNFWFEFQRRTSYLIFMTSLQKNYYIDVTINKKLVRRCVAIIWQNPLMADIFWDLSWLLFDREFLSFQYRSLSLKILKSI